MATPKPAASPTSAIQGTQCGPAGMQGMSTEAPASSTPKQIGTGCVHEERRWPIGIWKMFDENTSIDATKISRASDAPVRSCSGTSTGAMMPT